MALHSTSRKSLSFRSKTLNRRARLALVGTPSLTPPVGGRRITRVVGDHRSFPGLRRRPPGQPPYRTPLSNLGLIRFRGHVPKGGDDVQNGITHSGKTRTPAVQ